MSEASTLETLKRTHARLAEKFVQKIKSVQEKLTLGNVVTATLVTWYAHALSTNSGQMTLQEATEFYTGLMLLPFIETGIFMTSALLIYKLSLKLRQLKERYNL